jgi:hypothetical protein
MAERDQPGAGDEVEAERQDRQDGGFRNQLRVKKPASC